MRNQLAAYISLALAMAIVGSSVVVGKLMVETIPVFLSSGLRFMVAAIVLVILLFCFEKGFPALTKKRFFCFADAVFYRCFFVQHLSALRRRHDDGDGKRDHYKHHADGGRDFGFLFVERENREADGAWDRARCYGCDDDQSVWGGRRRRQSARFARKSSGRRGCCW